MNSGPLDHILYPEGELHLRNNFIYQSIVNRRAQVVNAVMASMHNDAHRVAAKFEAAHSELMRSLTAHRYSEVSLEYICYHVESTVWDTVFQGTKPFPFPELPKRTEPLLSKEYEVYYQRKLQEEQMRQVPAAQRSIAGSTAATSSSATSKRPLDMTTPSSPIEGEPAAKRLDTSNEVMPITAATSVEIGATQSTLRPTGMNSALIDQLQHLKQRQDSLIKEQKDYVEHQKELFRKYKGILKKQEQLKADLEVLEAEFRKSIWVSQEDKKIHIQDIPRTCLVHSRESSISRY